MFVYASVQVKDDDCLLSVLYCDLQNNPEFFRWFNCLLYQITTGKQLGKFRIISVKQFVFKFKSVGAKSAPRNLESREKHQAFCRLSTGYKKDVR